MKTVSTLGPLRLGQRNAKVPPINSPNTITAAPIQAYAMNLLREMVFLLTDRVGIRFAFRYFHGKTKLQFSPLKREPIRVKIKAPKTKQVNKRNQYSPFLPADKNPI